MSDTFKLRCFVVMPFSVREPDLDRYLNDPNHWHEVYEGLIRPSVKAAGLICERDDEDLSNRLIADNIWRKIEVADVILCDLSAANPNVLLELGWALRSDKRFVLIKDDLTPFNFDINQFYTFTYSHQLQPRALKQAISGLANILRNTLQDDTEKYSLIKKLSLSLSAIEVAQKGNLEVSLLNEIIQEIRNARGLAGETAISSYKSELNRVSVKIYWHSVGLEKSTAIKIKEELEKISITCKVIQHIDTSCPDSIYIGTLIGANEARRVISLVPYNINYIFRPDYPDKDGGDSSGLTIGIGYMSKHLDKKRGPKSEPIKISQKEIDYLIEPELTNTEFQKRLRELTKF
jgi:hypothetical protein